MISKSKKSETIFQYELYTIKSNNCYLKNLLLRDVTYKNDFSGWFTVFLKMVSHYSEVFTMKVNGASFWGFRKQTFKHYNFIKVLTIMFMLNLTAQINLCV